MTAFYARHTLAVAPRLSPKFGGITRGLAFLTLPAYSGGRDLVTNRTPKRVGVSFGPRSQYPGIGSIQTNPSASSGDGLQYAGTGAGQAYSAITINTYTILAYCRPAAVAVRRHLFTQGDPVGSPFTQITFAANSNEGSTASAGRFALYDFSSTFQAQVTTPSTSIDGDWHVWLGVRNGANAPQMFRDGVDVSTNAVGTSNATISSTYIGACGGIPGAALGCDFPVAMVAAWNRALTAQEISDVCANPFAALLAPQYGAQTYISRFAAAIAAPGFNAAWAVNANAVVSAGARAA